MRPIEHLKGQHVLVNSYLDTWKHMPDGDTAIVLTHVNLTDYETSKRKLAPVLDHCWIWVKEDAWKALQEYHVISENRLTLLDEVMMVARVEKYTRSDGSQDYGLQLLSWYPQTAAQCQEVRRGFTRREKLYQQGKTVTRSNRKATGNKITISDLGEMHMLLKSLEWQIEDWRCLGRSLKDARVMLLRNISAIEGRLKPLAGDALVDKQLNKWMETVGIPNLEMALAKRPKVI